MDPDLPTDLQAALHAASHRYHELADARRIDHADRFDWRSYLSSGPFDLM